MLSSIDGYVPKPGIVLLPFKYVLRDDIEDLVVGCRQRGLFSWFELWNEIYNPGHTWESLFPVGKDWK